MDLVHSLQDAINTLIGATVVKHAPFVIVLIPAYPILRSVWFGWISYKKVEKDIENRRRYHA